MERKYKVLAVGELNVDLILNQIKGFPEIGKEFLADSMALTLGSSTAIFASNVASLSTSVAFLGKIGKDSFGKLVKESLDSKGVDTSLVIEDETLATGATVVLNYSEDRAMITHPGAMNHLTIEDISFEKLKCANHMHFSSLFLQKGIQNDIGKLFKNAQWCGMTTSLDTQWDPNELWDFDYKNILPWVDVFMPNEKEVMLNTSSSTIEEAIEKMLPYLNCMVIKMGNQGSLLITKENKPLMLPAFLNNDVVDAIGAGDSFNAGFISKFVEGASLPECQRFGNLMGAINTTAAGGTSAFATKELIVKTAKEKFGQIIILE
jgi:sugar/nucleoside kinase (ribokinase family)